jgi:uroporphyrinogen III methyltransferase/synthase
LTARALELIASADVILFDRLIPPAALGSARADAELRYVGKEGGGKAVPQEETTALLIERARRGLAVVRLKGGDPFIFGRGGEEAQALRAAGIPFEVVPGVTAGVAAPAYAGIPVTHREHASAVAFVTAHEAGDELDWSAVASFPGTLVFYMGVRRLPEVADRLISAGRPADEPAAVIERGTLPDQRTVVATLATIAAQAEAAGVQPPAVTIVGQVAALDLTWASAGPLAGRTVAVTRARAQASELAERLRTLGARVVEAPAIRIEPRSDSLPELGDFDLIALTSPNGVRILFERLAERGEDARALAGATVAAIGPGTARALHAHGLIADVVPETSTAEGLVASLESLPVRRALVARAASARDLLPDALRERDVEVELVALYDTVPEPLSSEQLADVRGADYVTFTSSSTVRFFFDRAELEHGTRVVSIGPQTSAALRERGIEPHVEARRHDIDGLIEALLGDVHTGG